MLKNLKHVLCGLALIGGLAALDGGKATANIGHYIAKAACDSEAVDVAATAAGAIAGEKLGTYIGGLIGSAGGPIGATIGGIVGGAAGAL